MSHESKNIVWGCDCGYSFEVPRTADSARCPKCGEVNVIEYEYEDEEDSDSETDAEDQ
jgi:predicted RNA-binding Zn-ribbon protein involved in translation (DUF1610 family)